MIFFLTIVLGVPLLTAWVAAVATINCKPDVEIGDWDNGLATQAVHSTV